MTYLETSLEYLPVWQALHDVFAVYWAKVPGEQSVHTDAPDAENVPDAHAVHALPSAFKTVPVREA